MNICHRCGKLCVHGWEGEVICITCGSIDLLPLPPEQQPVSEEQREEWRREAMREGARKAREAHAAKKRARQAQEARA